MQAKAVVRNSDSQVGNSPRGWSPGLAASGAPALHMAGFRQTAAPAETVFVVVEQGEYDVSGHNIRRVNVWYILLVNSPADSGQGIPRKQT